MEDSEKMAALKRAYADIILNTAKEAAARIMVSERKAFRFQQDLCCTNDEALRMLVRLKQMIDAKTIEAETASLTQQKKIDELEAQLHEAEDIITDLRTELEWLHNKLKKQKNNQVQPLDGQTVKPDTSCHGFATPETIPTPPIPSSNLGLEAALTSDMKSTLLIERVVDSNCCNTTKVTEQITVSDFENCSVQKSDLPSIFVRSKEPELYRNGCTQRIRALERNLLNEKLLGDVNDQQSRAMHETVIEMSDKDEKKCTVPFPKIKNMDFMKKVSRKEARKPFKSKTLCGRKTRFGKTKATSCRSRPDLFVKSCKTPLTLSQCRTCSINGNVKPDEGSHILSSTEADNADKVKISGDLEKEMLHKSICSSNECTITDPGKSSCNSYSSPVFIGAESDKDQMKAAENEAKLKPFPRLNPGLTLIKSYANPKLGLQDVNGGLKVLNQCSLLQSATNIDAELRHESMVENRGVEAAESLTVPCSGLSPELVNVPLIYSDVNDLKAQEEGDKSPCKVDSDKFLKYTFHRKRKKESLSDPDNSTSPEISAIKRRAEKKQDAVPEKQKSSLVDESSRDSRRLAQVARQLISLSGKRWRS